MFVKIAPVVALVLAVLLYLWGNGVSSCKRHAPSASPTPAAAAPATPKKKHSPTPACTPTPKPTPIYIPQKRLEVGKLFNDMQLQTRFQSEPGTTATIERETPGSYAVEVTVKVKVPKANSDLGALSKINPALPTLLPGLPLMLEKARVSEKYEALYGYKLALLQAKLNSLDALLPRHDFYDCETILEMRHPHTKRTAVLLQADMDTDTDGSDPDRLPAPNTSDPTFQPMTTYKWPKQTELVSPFLAAHQAKLKALEARLAASKGLGAPLREALRDQVGAAQYEVNQLKNYSFLLAATDPYIVLPGIMNEGMDPAFQPKQGDYCAVIHDHIIYPAIVGDLGPRKVVGEASLRLAKEINSESSGLHRAESKLTVTYLIFPNTADDPPGPPDLDKWRARVESLLNEVGGYGGELHTWVNLSRPAPTPTPPPTPTPTPVPTPTPSASPSPLPGASPAVAPSASPGVSPCPSLTPCPTPPVCPSPSASVSPSATAIPAPTATPAPSVTPTPASKSAATKKAAHKKSSS